LELKNFYVGKKHVAILGSLIGRKGETFRSINLENTNMGLEGTNKFLENVIEPPKILNLSKNKLG
jgi:hypothetical protein